MNESLLLDLETAPDGKILKVGAICGAEEGFLKGRFRQSDVVQVLDGMAANARFVLGHNILDHDLPLLKKQFPNSVRFPEARSASMMSWMKLVFVSLIIKDAGF